MKRFISALKAIIPGNKHSSRDSSHPDPTGWVRSPTAETAPTIQINHIYATTRNGTTLIKHPGAPITLAAQPHSRGENLRYTVHFTSTYAASLPALLRTAHTALLFTDVRDWDLAARDAAALMTSSRRNPPSVEARFVPLLNVQASGANAAGTAWTSVGSAAFIADMRRSSDSWGATSLAMIVRWAAPPKEKALPPRPQSSARLTVAGPSRSSGMAPPTPPHVPVQQQQQQRQNVIPRRPVASKPAPARRAAPRPVRSEPVEEQQTRRRRPEPVEERRPSRRRGGESSGGEVSDNRRNTIWPGPNAPRY